MKTNTALFLCLLLGTALASAAEMKVNDKIPLAHFSSALNHDTFTYQDVLLVQIYRQNPGLPDTITNAPRSELTEANQFWGPLVKEAKLPTDLMVKGAGREPFPPSIFAGRYIQDQQAIKLPKFLSPLRIRKTWQELTKPPDETSAAQISYAQDFIKGDTTWNAQGAIGWDISQNWPGTNHLALTTLHLTPNAAFDRVTGKNPTDSLQFRLPVEAELAYGELPGPRPIESQWLRITPLYATDFSFKSDQVGGELEWEPLGESIMLGGYREIPGLGLQFDLHAFLHVEGGSVLDAGSNTNLVEGSSFLRIGPNVALKVRLASYHNLVFNASVADYEKIAFDNPATRLFSTGLSWEVVKGFSVEFAYRLGRIPLAAQKVNGLTLGIGLKF
jgi:hypothetical protein